MDDKTAQDKQGGNEGSKPIQNSSKSPSPPPLPGDAKKDQPDQGSSPQTNTKSPAGDASQPKTPQQQDDPPDLKAAKQSANQAVSEINKSPSPGTPGKTSADDKTQGDQNKKSPTPPGGSFANVGSGSTMVSQTSQSKTPPSTPGKPGGQGQKPSSGPSQSPSSTPGPGGQSQKPSPGTPKSTPPVVGKPSGGQSQTSSPSPESAVQSQVTSTQGSGNGGSKFKIFVIIGAVILLIIWAVVGYLYLQNTSLQEEVEGTDTAQTQEADTPTPTPNFTPDQVQIKNGNVVRVRPTGEESILINKENYQSTGITGFSSVAVSPDNNFICFESVPPAPEPALYYANVDGTNVTEVSPNRQSCNWHPESNMLAYNNYPAETGAVNIFLYDVATGEETNLTSEVAADAARQYSVDGFSQDGATLTCSFAELNSAGEPVSQGECEIEVQTGAYTELAS